MAWDRDLGDESPPAIRDRAPDLLSPIDEAAPVSGHRPPEDGHRVAASEAPEHDWAAASSRLFPLLRPVGSQGTSLADLDGERLAAEAARPHAQPVLDDGPAGIPIAFALRAGSFDVLVNPDHLLGWGVGAAELRRAAMRNLEGWSEQAPWAEEVSGHRRLVSSATGEGGDAARILVDACRHHLANVLGDGGRVLVGLPERHLLVAGSLVPGDEEFAALFADFVREQSASADEPIDRRLFELVDDELRPFEG
jgi:hypothetical protein